MKKYIFFITQIIFLLTSCFKAELHIDLDKPDMGTAFYQIRIDKNTLLGNRFDAFPTPSEAEAIEAFSEFKKTDNDFDKDIKFSIEEFGKKFNLKIEHNKKVDEKENAVIYEFKTKFENQEQLANILTFTNMSYYTLSGRAVVKIDKDEISNSGDVHLVLGKADIHSTIVKVKGKIVEPGNGKLLSKNTIRFDNGPVDFVYNEKSTRNIVLISLVGIISLILIGSVVAVVLVIKKKK